MPEQIKAAPADQSLPGETHDLSDFLAMSGMITMDVAMLAGRFIRERTFQPSVDGVLQEITTFCTVPVTLQLRQIWWQGA